MKIQLDEAEIIASMDRKTELLRAAYDILTECYESHYVRDALSVTAHYDDTDCDGYCLREDIAHELDIDIHA